MPRSKLDRGYLKSEEPGPKIFRYAKLNKPLTSILAKVVGDLDVDVIRRDLSLARPALVDDARQFVGDVQAPDVIPALFKPGCQFAARVAIHHIDVQFALVLQAGPGEVAASEIAYFRVNGIGAEKQIQLGVEGMPEEELHHNLTGSNLRYQAAETLFVFIGGRAESELVAEILGYPLFQADGSRAVHTGCRMSEAQGFAERILRKALHSDEQPATTAVSAGPALYVASDLFPAPKVEVADAKIRSIGKVDRLAQGGKKLLLDIVENARHPLCYSEDCVAKLDRFAEVFLWRRRPSTSPR